MRHEVTYDYNEMTDKDKSLTAMEIFEQTIQKSVVEGSLGNLTFSPCVDCKQPQCEYEKRLEVRHVCLLRIGKEHCFTLTKWDNLLPNGNVQTKRCACLFYVFW